MHKILILDFGSQYTQLIARRIREQHVYAEIAPCTWSVEQIQMFAPRGIVLSGGPASVDEPGAPTLDPRVLQLGLPVLGICYGMQLIAKLCGGTLGQGARREYGRAKITTDNTHALFHNIPNAEHTVWMSHGDHVDVPPQNFTIIAQTSSVPITAFANDTQQLYGLQFHPEVAHSECGVQMLKNFLFAICGCAADWSMQSFIERETHAIREKVGDAHVVCGVSGGVDSSVLAALLHKALGKQLHCFFVDNGLLRKNEAAKTPRLFLEHLNLHITRLDSAPQFLAALVGIDDPELKRKKIGHVFIEVFEQAAKQIPNAKFLAQGTLYPDVIESVSFKGPSATIKSHHNVGGLPERMGLTLLEPLRELFKDEVREVGKELGLPAEILERQPFPGPGLAVRVLGAITHERLTLLQNADDVMMQEIKASGWYTKIWQCFCVLLPVKTVGVMGDQRTYESVVAVRAVHSTDGMTADFVHLPPELLGKIANRIINEVRGINRVVYDITSKPPGTIEWE